MDLLQCTEHNVNNRSIIQVSQFYVHVSFCLKVIESCLNRPSGGHGHVICMPVFNKNFQVNNYIVRSYRDLIVITKFATRRASKAQSIVMY